METRQAIGLVCYGRTSYGNVVVNNIDIVNAHKTILCKQKQPRGLLDQSKGGSDFYRGVKNVFSELDLPNILFSDNLSNRIRSHLPERFHLRRSDSLQQIVEPRRIESKTSSTQGALYVNSSNNRFAAFLRYAKYSPETKKLYFCGRSVHPNVGIPLSLLSAKIMSEMVCLLSTVH